jgi:hypothetical protein
MHLKPESKNYKYWDAGRSFFSSSLQPLLDILAMLFLIKLFDVGIMEKTALAVVIRSGLILGLPATAVFAKLKIPINKSLFMIHITAAVCQLVIPFTLTPIIYILLFIVLSIAKDGINPLLSDIYSGYKKENRTKQYSLAAYAYILGGLCFSGIINLLFYFKINQHYILYPALTIPVILAGFCCLKLPSRTFSEHHSLGLKSLMAVFKSDKLFIFILISWFLMGSSNLWLITYRTNLLIEEQFGFSYRPETVLLLLYIIPESVRFLSIPMYVWLMDHINFIVLRIIINLLFGMYFAFFFIGQTFVFHLTGSIFFGIACGGGSIIWRLWINKLAPPGKSPAYMSIHSGLTGIRSILTPLFGFLALSNIGPVYCAVISISLTAVSIIMLLFIIPFGKTRFNN